MTKTKMYLIASTRIHLALHLFIIMLLPAGCGITNSSVLSVNVKDAVAESALSREDRIEIFEEVWRTIKDEYYDPAYNGVDWQAIHEKYRPRVEAATTDRNFYQLFEEMLAVLRDAHTVFLHPTPNSAQERPPTGSIGFSLGEVEGKTVVTSVEPHSDAARSGVQPGMVLRTVNDRPVDHLYAEIRSRFAGSSSERATRSVMHKALLYGGFLGASRRFGIEGFDNALFSFEVINRSPLPSSPLLTARRLSSGAGYLKFNGWRHPIDEQFKFELEKMRDSTGLIIDLRGNGGGDTGVLLNIASNFFPTVTNYGAFKSRQGTLQTYSTHPPERLYKKPVVILVDAKSASASESFSVFMQESRRAYIVGEQTCGCTLNQKNKLVKGGGTLLWSYRSYISPAGRNLEGVGIIPDKTVALTISDLRRGRDAALEAAENRLAPGRR